MRALTNQPMFLEGASSPECSEEEEEASRFAADLLIPPAHARLLPGIRTRAQILTFAERLGIAPGIVAGRLQHDGRLTHWHPNVERVTVLSGTFHLGHGEVVDMDKVESLEPGSYTSMPPGMRHFAIAEGETIVQLTTVGPWEIHYVNPDDDPRRRD